MKTGSVFVFWLFYAAALVAQQPESSEPALQTINLYAPLVLYSPKDRTLPSSIDWYLARSTLWCFNATTKKRDCLASGEQTNQRCGGILDQNHMRYSGITCGLPEIDSEHYRDKSRKRGFFLQATGADIRSGAPDSGQWVTYYSVHPTDSGGWVVAYWRFYPYNNGWHGIGDHEGDWEATEVVFDRDMKPLSLALLGHRHIKEVPWKEIKLSETHPLIYAEPVGHTSKVAGEGPLNRFIRHETWSSGTVRWPDGHVTPSGGLAPLGIRSSPAQRALQYTGLWGSIHSRLLHNFGYWGPAFNETDETKTGFIRAWCLHWEQGGESECFTIPLPIRR